MLFLRTAAGGFVNAATIVRLWEEATGEKIAGLRSVMTTGRLP